MFPGLDARGGDGVRLLRGGYSDGKEPVALNAAVLMEKRSWPGSRELGYAGVAEYFRIGRAIGLRRRRRPRARVEFVVEVKLCAQAAEVFETFPAGNFELARMDFETGEFGFELRPWELA